MPATFMTLPLELREQILTPLVQAPGTIDLQYPIWVDKTVFVPAIGQVCKELREEVIQSFYRTNVFLWKIDAEPVRDSRDWIERVHFPDPSTFPLEQCDDNSKHYGPAGPLVSSLPWQYPHMLANLRHLRLNLWLPPQHDIALWNNKFSKQLSSFAEAIDHGQRLKDLHILIGTWHKIRELAQPQSAAFGALERMQVRGIVQVRTRSLDRDGKAFVCKLDLERRMRVTSSSGSQSEFLGAITPGGRHLDWEWDGGATVQ